MSTVGHNSVAADQLRSYIERIENLNEEKSGLLADIREVKAEAKANGYDVKAINEILKIRKMDPNTRDEQEYMVDTYKRALNMLPELDDE